MWKNECTWRGLGSVMLAADLLAAFAQRSRAVRRPSWWRGAIPPKPQVQGPFRKQSLDQGQVQSRHTLAIQHQDLVAWTETCMQTQVCFRKKRPREHLRHDLNSRESEKLPPPLKASPSERTSLTKILLFLWLSMCPVMAKPEDWKK